MSRIKLFFHHIMYYFFNPRLIEIIIFILSVLNWLASKSVVAVLIPMISFLMVDLFVYKYFGKILLIYYEKEAIHITMRGVINYKSKTNESTQINQLFKDDFSKYIKEWDGKKDIIINTHSIYSKGVLEILHNEFGQEEKALKLSDVIKDSIIVGDIKISATKKNKHPNYMAAIQIPLCARKETIDSFFNKVSNYYEIRISYLVC